MPPSPADALSTTQLLLLWYGGETGALNTLLDRHAPWIIQRVRQRLGPQLRTKIESTDIIQEAMLRFLKSGPRIRIQNEDHFRRLVARIIENVLRDTSDFWSAERRALANDHPDSSDTIIDLEDLGVSPPTAAEGAEDHARLRLALELLSPTDRRILLLRTREGLSSVEAGERLGITPNTADCQYRRAARRCTQLLQSITGRDVDGLLARCDQHAKDDEKDEPDGSEGSSSPSQLGGE